MSGPFAGRYDPRQATVYNWNRTKSSTGEPLQVSAVFCKRYIRFKPMFAREQQAQLGQAQSVNVSLIGMRRCNKTLQIAADMMIQHPTGWWGIVGIVPVDYTTDEIVFQCQTINPPTPH